MTGMWVLLAAFAVAAVTGLVLRRRSGTVRVVDFPRVAPESEHLSAHLLEAGLVDAGKTDLPPAPLILHFSASWCGPCVAVRELVDKLADELPSVRHIEVDVAEHPQLSSELRVLSLPTVLVYDADMRQRFRVAGTPSAADLRAVLLPLFDGGNATAPTSG